MRIRFKTEFIVSLLLIASTLLLLDPLNLWMPTNFDMMILVLVVVFFVVYFIYIWREKSADERELIHRATAGRVAYLAGASVLVIGTVVQSLNHTLDPWIVISLTVMVMSKIITLVYKESKN